MSQCFTTYRVGDIFVNRPCNKLRCGHCQPRLRRRHTDELMLKIGSTPLYEFRQPDVTAATVKRHIRAAGGHYVIFPRRDGRDLIVTDVPVFDARRVEGDLDDLLFTAFMATPVGQRVQACRAWSYSDDNPPRSPVSDTENPTELSERKPVWGYRLPYREIVEISQQFRLKLVKLADGPNGSATRVVGLDDLNDYERAEWVMRTGEYLVKPRQAINLAA